MPAMYPEELRRMREQNPDFQYDFRGNVVGTNGSWLGQQVQDLFYKPDYDVSQPSWNQLYQNYGPANGDALSRIVQGLDGFNYMPEGNEQYGPPLPGMPRPGQHLDLGTPRAGLHTRWNPNTNSWDRMTDNPESWSEAGAMDFSKWGQETPH